MSVTFTACANSTPPDGTVIAGCSVGGEIYQYVILADATGNTLGSTGSPLVVSVGNSPSVVVSSGSMIVTNALSASISNSPSVIVSSGSVVVTNALSASISGGSLALLAGANTIGAASAIQSGAWAVTASIANSPSMVVSSGSVIVTNSVSASISNSPSVIVSSGSTVVTNALSASISGGSLALLTGANVIGSASVIQSTPTGIGNAWPVKITDGTDTVSVNSSSQLAVAVSSASVTIVDTSGNQFGISAGSPLYVTGGAGGTSSNDTTVFAAGTTSLTPVGGFYSTNPVALTACQVGAARVTAYRAMHTSLRDEDGNILGITGSPVVVSLTAASVTVVNNAAGASVLYTSACITNLAGSAAASPLFASITNTASVIVSSGSVVVTNALSSSISGGSVALLTGANVVGSASVIQSTPTGIGNAWPVKITDGTDAAAVTSASEQLVFVNNTACVIVSSGSTVVTNALSASISGGSVAMLTGANVIGSASVIQSTPNSIANAWPMRLATSTGSNVGVSGSALPVAYDSGYIWMTGSYLSVCSLNLSSSISGCTIMLGGSQNFTICVLAATYTTTGSQRIGWISGSSASTLLQTPMGFADFGGMDVQRGPMGCLYRLANGSALVMTTTSACYVAGNINFVFAPV